MNKMRNFYLIYVIFILAHFIVYNHARIKNKNVVDNIAEFKDFKKLLRTKTNVLVCFTRSLKESADIIKVFKEAAESIKGEGTMVLIDCSSDAKKMCKKLKVNPTPTILKHYKDGEFNKDYDRKDTVNSMLNFMRDPTGDIPWEEDSTATDVLHLSDATSLAKLIRKEQKPLMIMFYAPWCGFCKTLKPEYAGAASELKKHSVLAAIDVNRPENTVLRTHYNITGFPTMLYYEKGILKHQYEGENNKAAIVAFMKNPKAPPVKPKEVSWNETQSDVVHLSNENFENVLKTQNSALVMFYAPWCGHCKRMKPEYEKAASILKEKKIQGILSALDATKEQQIASQFNVKGYPTLKYFSNGEFQYNVDFRDSGKIVTFMENPREPPPPPPPELPWSEQETEVVHLDEENYKTFLKKKKHALVMFYAPWCGHCKKVKPEFTKAADFFKDDPRTSFVAIDCTTKQTLCSLNEISGYPTIKYFSYLNKAIKNYNGGRSFDDFIKFMSDPDKTGASPAKDATPKEKMPVTPLDNENFKEFISTNEPTLVMFHTEWCGKCKEFMPVFRAVAKDLFGKVEFKFAIMDCSDGIGEVIEEYDIRFFPSLKLFRNGQFERDYDMKRNKDDLTRFAKKYVSAKVEL